MAFAKITLIGMSNFTDGAIWEDLNLPEMIDKETAISSILMQGGEFPVLYPEADFLSEAIKAFSNKWFHNFEKWAIAEQFEYNALYNLDVSATYTDDSAGTDVSKGNSEMINQAASYDSEQFKNTNRTSGESDNTITHSANNTRTELRQGNQGVTMSQEMLKAEYEVRKWNLYQHIADVFITEFCICIYD